MALDTYALTTVDEIKAYLGGDLKENAFWVYFSDPASTATAEVHNSYLYLKHNNNPDASLDLTNSSYNTLTKLVNYINASVSGWEAKLIHAGAANSVDLIETGELNALGKSNIITLDIYPSYILIQLINRTSDLIERYCNRKLKSRNYYRETYDGNGLNKLILEQFPVTQVSRVSIGRTNCFSIKNTNTSATYATIEVTSTLVKLTEDGSTTDLTLTDYANINALITAIEAAGNWDCVLLDSSYGTIDLCYGTNNTSNILVRPAMACLIPKITYVEIVDDEIDKFHILSGPSEDRNSGILELDGGTFTKGIQNVFVDYTAGYTSPVPYSLEMACLELVKYKYNQKDKDLNLKSERMGKVYEYHLQDIQKGLPQEIRDELDMFREREF